MMEKPVAGNISLMLKFSWEMLHFESGNTEFFKADRNMLVASNEKKIDNHTLMLDINFTLTCQSCVPTIEEVS